MPLLAFYLAVRRVCLIWLAGALLVIHAPSAWGEGVRVLGADFPVDEIKRIDAENSKVTIFGEMRIVRNEQLENFVVRQYFERRSLGKLFEGETLERFIKKALDSSNQSLALLAFQAMLSEDRESQDRVLKFVQSLTSIPAGIQLFKTTLASSPDFDFSTPAVVSALVFYVGCADPDWVRANTVRAAYRFQPELTEHVQRHFVDAMSARDVTQLNRILEFFKAIYGPADEEYRHLKVVQGKYGEIAERLQREEEPASLAAAQEMLHADPMLQRALGATLQNELHQQARQALARKDFLSALNFLALVEHNKRSPATFELLRAALSGITPADPPVLRENRIRRAVAVFSADDEYLKALYVSLLEQQIQLLLQRRAVSYVDEYLNALQLVRPDPNASNDRLRIEFGRVLRAMGRTADARRIEGEVQTSYTAAVTYVRFFISDLLRRFFPVLIVLAALVLVYLGVRIHQHRGRAIPSGGRRTGPELLDGPQGDAAHRFVMTNVRHALDPRMREYLSCLRFFNLPDDADIKAIKLAYRNMVKECHPDMRRQTETLASNRFIEVTQVYERLLELRQAITGQQDG